MNPIIYVEGLNKYYGKARILKDVNLQINSGEVIGYIGPNGAGKSTTIKILTGLIPDFEGEVKVLGFDIRTQDLEVKRRVGYVPENAALYEVLTPYEYLLFVGQLYGLERKLILEKAEHLLTLFGLKDSSENRMTSFSKGMKQKVLLISGVLHNPEIIFLDEPLSGLDANAVILVKEILSQLKKQGKTIFYSSHLMDVVEKISDRIVIVNEGKIIANGTFDELKSSGSASLEQIFTHLTGDNGYEQAAEQFIKTIGE